eukprot:TRINITY_DN71523_c0_g1_i1.p1 TRINITY_DN71523_c0_g1~~TRINITY_DN71523_c0_g1_i1.p1  ORF type:complete len:235 (-),score=34.77 TRINITY_DN71523_c0_g1_i1:55-690(-)
MHDLMHVRLLLLNGDEITVKARSSWKVWQFKECVRKRLRTPEYEQHFVHQDAQMSSEDTLSALSSACEGNEFTCSFLRRPRPPCISKGEAEELWEAFLTFSPNSGDTMDGANMARVARFAGMFDESELVAKLPNIPDSVTFPELLEVLASVKVAAEPRTTRKPTDDVLHEFRTLDCGRVSVPRIVASETSSEASDESDEEDAWSEVDDRHD